MTESKRELWSDDEWILSLGYYIFDKKAALNRVNLAKFTKALNAHTGKKRTPASIEMRMCNYRSVDQEFSGKGLANDGQSLHYYWNTYVVNEPSQRTLSENYSNFINNTQEIEFSINNKKIINPIGKPKSRVVTTVIFDRSPAVREFVLKRASGVCELCKSPAPFTTFEGRPYLEIHYIESLAYGGLDINENAAALCPNCHRMVHYSNVPNSTIEKLKKEIIYASK